MPSNQYGRLRLRHADVPKLAELALSAPCMPDLGDLYRLPDRLTGFSDDLQKVRWCAVVEVARYSVRVAPRSKTSEAGVYVARDVMPHLFSDDGRFYDDWKSIPLADLRGYDLRGRLPAAARDAVVDQYLASEARKIRRRRERRSGR
jgi:hypothetical protein